MESGDFSCLRQMVNRVHLYLGLIFAWQEDPKVSVEQSLLDVSRDSHILWVVIYSTDELSHVPKITHPGSTVCGNHAAPSPHSSSASHLQTSAQALSTCQMQGQGLDAQRGGSSF